MSSVHFQSGRSDWCTPRSLFDRLNACYGFNLDAAASSDNALCDQFYDVATNGLVQSWAGYRVWCNPPYGRAIGDWVDKAIAEHKRAQFIVMLIPARTDTKWYHRAVKTARVQFLEGRLRFEGAESSAPFPSALLFWGC